jgi:hypothetical protein
MAKLKLGAIPDDRPVKITVELPATVYRDLVAYAELLGREAGQAVEPVRLVAPMLARFMATDRGFGRARRSAGTGTDAIKQQEPPRSGVPTGLGEAN